MLFAWSVTETIRYTFYFFSVMGVNIRPLTYLRYSTFLPLYPIGASSEAFLSFSTLPSFNSLPFWPEGLSAWNILDKIPSNWRTTLLKSSLGRAVVWKIAKGGAGLKRGVVGTWGWMEYVRLALFVVWWPCKCIYVWWKAADPCSSVRPVHTHGKAKKEGPGERQNSWNQDQDDIDRGADWEGLRKECIYKG
jgi:hypothetical protein